MARMVAIEETRPAPPGKARSRRARLAMDEAEGHVAAEDLAPSRVRPSVSEREIETRRRSP
jgi:hypothetical protein